MTIQPTTFANANQLRAQAGGPKETPYPAASIVMDTFTGAAGGALAGHFGGTVGGVIGGLDGVIVGGRLGWQAGRALGLMVAKRTGEGKHNEIVGGIGALTLPLAGVTVGAIAGAAIGGTLGATAGPVVCAAVGGGAAFGSGMISWGVTAHENRQAARQNP